MKQDADRVAAYLELLKRLGEPLGDWRKGEVEIVAEADAILAHERALAERYASQGKDPSLATTGIMYQAQYDWFLREPVLFPPPAGHEEPVRGTYIRIVYKENANGNPSIFLLTVGADGRLILNRSYKHPVRRWLVDGQGTIARSGEALDDSIRRCVRDEIGMPILSMTYLSPGFISDRGVLGCRVPMFLVRVVGELPEAVDDPTVVGHVALTPGDYEAVLKEGSMEIGGVIHFAHEGYTVTAYTLAKLRGLL
mgnify:FL=1